MRLLRLLSSTLIALAFITGCKSSGIALNPPSAVSIYHSIIVSNVTGPAVLTYPLDAGASTAPTTTLSSGAGLDQPEGIFADRATQTLWVGNYSGGSAGTVAEYSLASGSTTPLKTIGGATTTIAGPGGIYVDGSGNLYVSDYDNAAIDVFSSSASGDVAPARQIAGATTTIVYPTGLWLDASGNIWVGNSGGTGTTGTLLKFSSTASGDVAPALSITLPTDTYPIGVFVDDHQNVWVADAYGDAIYEYAAGATSSSTPSVTISGASTGLDEPQGVFVDSTGKVYVANYSSDDVEIFAAGAHGNATPVQTIPANGTTNLGVPIGVVLY